MTDEEELETGDDQDQSANLTRRERRAQAKGGGEDGTIRDRNAKLRAQASARRKKQRVQERAEALGEGLAASERVDDALARSADATGRFLKSHFAWLQWLILLGAGAAIFSLIYGYRSGVQRQKHGAALAAVLDTASAKVPGEDPIEARDPRLVDTRPEFATEEDRAAAARKAWTALTGQAQEVQLRASLGAANASYDLQEWDKAIQGYRQLIDKKTVSQFPDLHARALEGLGLAQEAAEKMDEAKASFQKLSAVDDQFDRRLGQYHLARLHYLQGEIDEAKKKLAELDEKLSKDAPPQGPDDYLGAAVRDLRRTVDRTFAIQERQALEKQQAEEQAKRLQQMIEEMQKKNGNFSFPSPGSPPTTPSGATLPKIDDDEAPKDAEPGAETGQEPASTPEEEE